MILLLALLILAWIARFLSWTPPSVSTALVAAVILFGGVPIASNALRGVLRRELNVDSLVTVAAVAAVALGSYFEAAIVILILTLGELLEQMTVARTGRAIRGLAQLLPDTVTCKAGDREREIPTSHLNVSDVIIVRSGERIAVDGFIVRGQASIDESHVTGESLPVDKREGDDVYSGTLNRLGAIEIAATRVGPDTTVARIGRMVLDAQRTKAPVERLVNRFAKYFVPAVLVLAAIIYLATSDARRAITVLVVACPCALVLGTPTAMVAGIGAAARRGLLIRGGDALETLGRVDSVVFDKTGTLTLGAPRVVSIKQICGHPDRDVLQFAAVAERLSEHPLAGAILDRAREWDLAVSAPEHLRVKTGQGVEVRHDGLTIILGNRSLLADNGIAVTPEVETFLQDREIRGETALLVAHDREICGVITLADPLREEAPDTIRALMRSGVHRIIAMYTGDNHRTASAIASSLGIQEVAAGLLPEDKARKIRSLMDRGHTVAMVGDGINDAPALAVASVGIAMGSRGTDISRQAAHVTLLNDNLLNVPAAISLGKKTLSVIRQDILFAILFNAVMILLASTGRISIIVGAVCHQASSLLVILNAMRLLRWHAPDLNRVEST